MYSYETSYQALETRLLMEFPVRKVYREEGGCLLTFNGLPPVDIKSAQQLDDKKYYYLVDHSKGSKVIPAKLDDLVSCIKEII